MTASVRRYLTPRHPWLLGALTAGLSVVALTTTWLNLGIEVKVLGGRTPRMVGTGEAASIALGLAGAALGTSGLASWEQTGARSLRVANTVWALATMAAAALPLVLIPLGPARQASPGIPDSEWFGYAYSSIAPFLAGVVMVTAVGLIVTARLGRTLGPLVVFAGYWVLTLVQSLRVPGAAEWLCFPGAPGPPGGAAVVHPPTWELALVAMVFATVACVAWGRRRRPST